MVASRHSLSEHWATRDNRKPEEDAVRVRGCCYDDAITNTMAIEFESLVMRGWLAHGGTTATANLSSSRFIDYDEAKFIGIKSYTPCGGNVSQSRDGRREM